MEEIRLCLRGEVKGQRRTQSDFPSDQRDLIQMQEQKGEEQLRNYCKNADEVTVTSTR